MSKRKLGNLLKRKFSFWQKLSFRNFAGNKWAKKQLQELSRLGGKLVVMKNGSRHLTRQSTSF